MDPSRGCERYQESRPGRTGVPAGTRDKDRVQEAGGSELRRKELLACLSTQESRLCPRRKRKQGSQRVEEALRQPRQCYPSPENLEMTLMWMEDKVQWEPCSNWYPGGIVEAV